MKKPDDLFSIKYVAELLELRGTGRIYDWINRGMIKNYNGYVSFREAINVLEPNGMTKRQLRSRLNEMVENLR